MSASATWKQIINAQVQRTSSVVLIMEDEHSQALLVKAKYKRHWTFPGGFIDTGETPLEAAIREVQEEVGITLDPADVEFLFVVDRVSDIAHTYQFAFRTQVSTAQLQCIVLQESEIAKSDMVSKEQVRSSVNSRVYSGAIHYWASDITGYVEQKFRVPTE